MYLFNCQRRHFFLLCGWWISENQVGSPSRCVAVSFCIFRSLFVIEEMPACEQMVMAAVRVCWGCFRIDVSVPVQRPCTVPWVLDWIGVFECLNCWGESSSVGYLKQLLAGAGRQHWSTPSSRLFSFPGPLASVVFPALHCAPCSFLLFSSFRLPASPACPGPEEGVGPESPWTSEAPTQGTPCSV